MLVTAHMTLTEVRDRLFEVVDRLEREHGRVAITKHGRPVAVLLSVDDWSRWRRRSTSYPTRV